MSEYKDMVKIITEANLGSDPYGKGKEPTKGDWFKTKEGAWYAIDSKGERQGPFNDENDAEEYAKKQVGGGDTDKGDDEEDSAGKLSGGDFDRDGDSTDYDGDGDADSADKGGEQYSTNIKVQQSSIEGDDDAQQNAQMALQGQEMNMAHSNLKDAGHEELAGALGSDLPEDEKMKILKHAMGDDWMGRTGKELGKNETLKINGKVYRKVQEETTTDKHPLRESYERIGGK